MQDTLLEFLRLLNDELVSYIRVISVERNDREDDKEFTIHIMFRY